MHNYFYKKMDKLFIILVLITSSSVMSRLKVSFKSKKTMNILNPFETMSCDQNAEKELNKLNDCLEEEWDITSSYVETTMSNYFVSQSLGPKSTQMCCYLYESHC